jgi:hypothetical protein
MSKLVIIIPQFITHVRVRPPNISGKPSKSKKSDYWKLNYNRLYSNSIHFAVRNYMASQLHDFLDKHIPKTSTIKTPVTIKLEFHVPINYGSLSIRKNVTTLQYELCWKSPKPNYTPNWDDDNAFFYLWYKTIKDHISGRHAKGQNIIGLIPNDSVQYCRGGSWDIVYVDHIDDRKLIITIEEI